jgi:hypothetical protein
MKLVWGVFRLAAIAAATVWLAGCMTAAVGPDHPGTRVRYKSRSAEVDRQPDIR